MPKCDAALCRAARFCNGAAHGGQVVGPSTIVPGLQAWGCEKIPDPQMSGTELQVCPQITICIKLDRKRKCPFRGIVGLDELTWCCTLRVCKDSKLCSHET